MAIMLNHTIVAGEGQESSSSVFADTFGLSYDASDDHSHFAPVRVNDTLELLLRHLGCIQQPPLRLSRGDAEFDAFWRA